MLSRTVSIMKCKRHWRNANDIDKVQMILTEWKWYWWNENGNDEM